MARFTTDVPTPYTPQQVNDVVAQFAQSEGFTYETRDGEQVLKKGMGIMTGPQFIKIVIQPGNVHLEAWIKFALLPGVYVGEMGLKGVMGWAIKAALKARVDRLITTLQSPQNAAAQNTAAF